MLQSSVVYLYAIGLLLWLAAGTPRLWRRDQRPIEATDHRIVGGNAATIDQAPYLINLKRNGQFICGGSLITPHCVLTAAHCVFDSAQLYTVSAGESRLSQLGEERHVQEFYVPEDFTTATLDMDVAVLRLAQPLQGATTRTIELCQRRPHPNEYVQVFGWGLTSEQAADVPDQMRTANVRLTSTLQCQIAYAGKAKVTENMLCASVPGVKDSCSGDSGGPLVYKQQLCGIVSWGFGCARPQYPGVYTDVTSARVKQFIQQRVSQVCIAG